MRNNIITEFEKKQFASKKNHPEFRSGDTVRVHYKIQEGAEKDKFRIQVYEGIVLRRRRGTADASFTVRKISAGGVGVERTFPLFSPFIDRIEVAAKGIVRRSRLYYLRDLTGKAARIQSKFDAGTTAAAVEVVEAVNASESAAATEQ